MSRSAIKRETLTEWLILSDQVTPNPLIALARRLPLLSVQVQVPDGVSHLNRRDRRVGGCPTMTPLRDLCACDP